MDKEKKTIHNTKQQRMTEKEYLDFCGVNVGDDFDQIENKLLWQTMGKNRDKQPHWVKLIDCDNTHIQNILVTVKYIHPITKKVILSLLKDRWSKEQKEKDERTHKDLLQRIMNWEQKGYSLETIDKIIRHAESKREQNGATTIHIGTIQVTDNKDGVFIDRSSK